MDLLVLILDSRSCAGVIRTFAGTRPNAAIAACESSK